MQLDWSYEGRATPAGAAAAQLKSQARESGKRVVITVDGIEMRHVFFVDDLAGIVRCRALNAEGKKYLIWGNEVANVEHRGIVSVELAD